VRTNDGDKHPLYPERERSASDKLTERGRDRQIYGKVGELTEGQRKERSKGETGTKRDTQRRQRLRNTDIGRYRKETVRERGREKQRQKRYRKET